MDVLADSLLILATFCAALYCFILGRRLRRFSDLESGMGNAVKTLSIQVDELVNTVNIARISAAESKSELELAASKAERVKRELQLQMASLHDVIPANSVAETPTQRMANRSSSEPLFMRHKTQAESS